MPFEKKTRSISVHDGSREVCGSTPVPRTDICSEKVRSEWKSFILDMDEREPKEWRPRDEKNWYVGKLIDDKNEKSWEGHFGRKVSPIPNQRT